MDRISKAVERARKEREKRGSQSVASSKKESQQYSYTQTRKIALDKALLRRNRILTGDGREEMEHAFKVLRTRVWHQMKDQGWGSLAVSSCKPGEGKTFTAINLAISLAMMKANHSVLLVDLDLRRPSVHRYLGLDVKYGINDYLVGGVPLEEVMVSPNMGRFVVLPGREAVANSSELLSSVRIENLVQEFKTRYPSRIVIFDLPPILSTDDVLVFAPYIDALLLVIEEGAATTQDVTKAVSLLRNTELLGTVLNKSDEVVPTYY